MKEQERIKQLVRQALGNDYLDLRVDRVTIEEDLEANASQVRAQLHNARTGEKQALEGSGVGVVDGFFQALVSRLATEYPSLRTIEFAKFSIDGRMGSRRNRAGADAEGEVTLLVTNSDGREFEFTDSSRSITASAIRTVLAAVEYFVNSERAFVAVWKRLEDAKERSRADLVQSYTDQLIELVKNTSYSEVIEGIKKRL